MFTTEKYNTAVCECGIPINFSLVRPVRAKLADVISIQVNNFVVTLNTRTNHNITVNTVVDIVSGGNISQAFIGQRTVTAVTATSISFGLRVPDIVTTSVTAFIYSVPNIANSDSYIVKFTKELSVPDDASVEIFPSVYEINGANNFEPQTTVKIFSNFTTASKTIIKLSITDRYNRLLFTEYKQISCSRLLDVPCEIKSRTVINTEYVYLNRQNSWTYRHNGFLIAQFIPYNDDPEKNFSDISIRLIKQDAANLPANMNDDRLALTVNPIMMQIRGVTRTQLRDVILQNPTSTALKKNISVDDRTNTWIIQSSSLTTTDLENLVVLNTPVNPIIVSGLGRVFIPKIPDHPIPGVSQLKTIRVRTYREDHILGQFLYYPEVYANTKLVLYSNDYPPLHFTINDYSLYGQEGIQEGIEE